MLAPIVGSTINLIGSSLTAHVCGIRERQQCISRDGRHIIHYRGPIIPRGYRKLRTTTRILDIYFTSGPLAGRNTWTWESDAEVIR